MLSIPSYLASFRQLHVVQGARRLFHRIVFRGCSVLIVIWISGLQFATGGLIVPSGNGNDEASLAHSLHHGITVIAATSLFSAPENAYLSGTSNFSIHENGWSGSADWNLAGTRVTVEDYADRNPMSGFFQWNTRLTSADLTFLNEGYLDSSTGLIHDSYLIEPSHELFMTSTGEPMVGVQRGAVCKYIVEKIKEYLESKVVEVFLESAYDGSKKAFKVYMKSEEQKIAMQLELWEDYGILSVPEIDPETSGQTIALMIASLLAIRALRNPRLARPRDRANLI
jgi:hypothetical protein